MTGPAYTQEVCDAEQRRLSVAAEAIAATLVELDAEPTLRLLAAGVLRGTTAAAWREIQTVMSELWSGHGVLTDVVGRAAVIRGSGRRIGRDELTQLAELLFGSSIELSSSNVGLFERTLLGPRVHTTRTSPGGLVAQLEAAFGRVQKPLVAVASAWNWQMPRLSAGEVELRTLQSKGPGEPLVARAAAALGALADRVGADPLGIHYSDFDVVEDSLARAREAVSSAAELQARIHEIQSAAPGLLQDIRAVHEEALAAHADAVAKIVGFTRPEPTAPDRGLADELAKLSSEKGLRAAGTGARYLAWQSRARYAYEQAVADRDAAKAPLRERSELRGRLEAYRAKAQRYGLAESVQLARMARRAQDLLYVAPCDLVTARSAVSAFIAAVTSATAPSGATGGGQ